MKLLDGSISATSQAVTFLIFKSDMNLLPLAAKQGSIILVERAKVSCVNDLSCVAYKDEQLYITRSRRSTTDRR